jgi:hypothetical protein
LNRQKKVRSNFNAQNQRAGSAGGRGGEEEEEGEGETALRTMELKFDECIGSCTTRNKETENENTIK